METDEHNEPKCNNPFVKVITTLEDFPTPSEVEIYEVLWNRPATVPVTIGEFRS